MYPNIVRPHGTVVAPRYMTMHDAFNGCSIPIMCFMNALLQNATPQNQYSDILISLLNYLAFTKDNRILYA